MGKSQIYQGSWLGEKLFDTTSRDCIIDSVDGKGTKKWIGKYKKSVAKGTKIDTN